MTSKDRVADAAAQKPIKAVVILNLLASRALHHEQKITSFYEEQDIVVLKTESSDELTTLMHEAVKRKPDRIILAGGDGTVISGIKQTQDKGFVGSFGILPVGTANYTARNCKISLHLQKALRQSLSKKEATISLGEADGHPFALTASVGLLTTVVKRTNTAVKRRFGIFAYLIVAGKALLRHSSFTYELSVDGQAPKTGESHLVVVVNSRLDHYVQLAPHSSLSKSGFRVVIYQTPSVIGVLFNALIFIVSFGRIQRGYQDYTADEVVLTTIPKRSVSIDGDVRGATPMIVRPYERVTRIAGASVK